MSFDFDAAIKAGQQDLESQLLCAIVLGMSGSGKSRLLGTLGVKTLYLYYGGEDHGPQSASVADGSDIAPMRLDVLDAEGELDPDATLARTIAVLNNHAKIKQHGFGAVIIDGASELEAVIRQCKAWRKACLSAKGEHNAYEEPKATTAMLRTVVGPLKQLQRSCKVHVAITGILDVKAIGEFGEIAEASPRLLGFSVAETLIQQFADVLVVGRMVRNEEVKYKLQFMTDLVKTSKDNKTSAIKKTFNFNPRITGATDVPSYLDADLKKVLELKGKTK